MAQLISRISPYAWLPLAWCVGVLLILDGRRDAYDPTGRAYGANYPGDLRSTLIMLTIEVAVLYAILRPWSYRGSWRRAESAIWVVGLWTAFFTMMIMHTGRIWHGLWFWHVLVTLSLVAVRRRSKMAAARDATESPAT